ncbi:hypothetical protein K437DRAFT_265660 [Tilletiaria anomala UBC 951]|uniref:Zn(2)-C6 fungal-type domain-containing protein n=1 Tax=Tilletiaria anomala (strain ATCC 24038 / CBS 436.72 / UBC 951) TaxID=1037660 RepID=A0A066WID7_TILAU|nr:uncharacterized protein K437DRAFT_265660 [Tilletiaria anomala UBC 951]KDN53606.1 hypothetical protein K437DRAFT_265660 [Tilletiaria anomala UBC 951]
MDTRSLEGSEPSAATHAASWAQLCQPSSTAAQLSSASVSFNSLQLNVPALPTTFPSAGIWTKSPETSTQATTSPNVTEQAPPLPINRLTPSCSRCRIKKLRCDRKQPCGHCIARGLEAGCHKDERLQRKSTKNLGVLPTKASRSGETKQCAEGTSQQQSMAKNVAAVKTAENAKAIARGKQGDIITVEAAREGAELEAADAEIHRLRARVAELEQAALKPSGQFPPGSFASTVTYCPQLAGSSSAGRASVPSWPPSTNATSSVPSSVEDSFKSSKSRRLAYDRSQPGARSPFANAAPLLLSPSPVEAAAVALESFVAPGSMAALEPPLGAEWITPFKSLVSSAGPDARFIPRSVHANSTVADDQLHPYWCPSSASMPHLERQTRRQELIQLLKRTKASLPFVQIETELLLVFRIRVNHIIGHCIYVPRLRQDLADVRQLSVHALAASPYGQDPSRLALICMILAVSFRIYPVNKPGILTDEAAFNAISSLKLQGQDASLKWHSLALECLAFDKVWEFVSLAGLQAASLLYLYSQDSQEFLQVVHRSAIQSAIHMGLNRLPAIAAEGGPGEALQDRVQNFLRRELGVRIWWNLTVKDWCNAARTYTCAIDEDQVTTRWPLDVSDANIQAYLDGRSDNVRMNTLSHLEEYNEMSFVFAQLELAFISKASVDLMNKQFQQGQARLVWNDENKANIDAQLTAYMRRLPHYFKPESTAVSPPPMVIQRWLINQQVFDVMLKLHRSKLSTPNGRASCLALAHSILSSHKRVRKACPIIDHFSINDLHLLGATLVIMIDLRLSDVGTSERRDIVEKVREVYRSLQASDKSSTRALAIVRTLLAEEERHSQAMEAGPSPPRSLAEKHADVLELANRTVKEAVKSQSAGQSDGSLLEVSQITLGVLPMVCAPWGPPWPPRTNSEERDEDIDIIQTLPQLASSSVSGLSPLPMLQQPATTAAAMATATPDQLFDWLLAGERLPAPQL